MIITINTNELKIISGGFGDENQKIICYLPQNIKIVSRVRKTKGIDHSNFAEAYCCKNKKALFWKLYSGLNPKPSYGFCNNAYGSIISTEVNINLTPTEADTDPRGNDDFIYDMNAFLSDTL